MIINSSSIVDETEVTKYYTRNGVPMIEVMFFPGCHTNMYNPATDIEIDRDTYLSLFVGKDKIEVE